jgi:hypothetical protein
MFHNIRVAGNIYTRILRKLSELHQDVAAEVPTSAQSLTDMFQPWIEHLQGTCTASEKTRISEAQRCSSTSANFYTSLHKDVPTYQRMSAREHVQTKMLKTDSQINMKTYQTIKMLQHESQHLHTSLK